MTMQTIEITAKSVDEAKAAAAAKLGVDAATVVVEVLEETKGLFGKTNLRVRASVADAPAPAAEKPAKKEPAAKKAPAKKAVVEEAAAPEPVAEEKPAAKPSRSRKKAEEPAAEPVEAAEPEGEEEDSRPDVVATDEDAAQIADIVNELLELADLEAEVRLLSLTGRYVNLELDGRDTAFLVGKHGEVLNNFQYLINVIISRKLGNGVRATLDGNDYRARREESLENLAIQIADQVKERGEEAVLDALPAFERRIIHRALMEIEGITTYSEGEEPNRRVVIAPGT